MFLARGYVAATAHLHALFIDVNEITDRTENALKIVGDIYAARLFRLTRRASAWPAGRRASRTSSRRSTTSIASPSSSSPMSRGHFLELTIILILVLELVLFFLGIMT